MSDPLRFLSALTFYEPTPIARELEPVAHHLAGLGYSTESIRRACQFIARTGSAHGSEDVDLEDLDSTEELVPGNAYRWPITPANDFYTYATAE